LTPEVVSTRQGLRHQQSEDQEPEEEGEAARRVAAAQDKEQGQLARNLKFRIRRKWFYQGTLTEGENSVGGEPL